MKMMSPRERYQNDVNFKTLVDMMVHHIRKAKFTPSEMRTAAVLASIIYEESNIHLIFKEYPQEVLDWLDKKED